MREPGTIHADHPGAPHAARDSPVAQPRVEREVVLRRTLALGDAVAALAAIAAAGTFFGMPTEQTFWAAVLLPVWIVLAKLHGLYDRDQRALRHLTLDEFPSLLVWAVTGTAVLAILLLVVPAGGTVSGADAVRIAAVACLGSLFARAVIRRVWRGFTPADRVAIIGDGPAADALRRKLDLFPDIHVRIVEERPALQLDDLNSGARWLEGIDRIFCAEPSDQEVVRRLAELCRSRQIRLSVVPPLAGVFGTAVQLNHVADLALIEYSTWDVSRSTVFLKRIIDVVVSVVSLVVLVPVFMAITVAILLDSGRPVIFRQLRATTGGRPFWILKFRTMVPDAEDLLSSLVDLDDLDDPMFKLTDDPRRTRVGRFLRRWSLDELPQLVNVLSGDMSLVGPRPEQVELVQRYTPDHRFRLGVKPGLTGPMQVYGRGRLTFDERMAVERDYVESLSLARDFRILGMTIAAIWGGRGAY